ncbi:MAG TPA: DUF2202 domain-containing protein [Propionibacteriaceae bacterium]|nr:DUF2202 domain-containing protein [Propionibacteriaceae bacterium]
MNTSTKTTIVISILGSLAGAGVLAAPAIASPPWAGHGAAGVPAATTTPAVASAQLAADLSWMREEERFARDVYTSLAATYDDALPFASIAMSEQQHFDAIGILLTRYGIADPSSGKSAGTYAEPELQARYTALMEQGKASLAAAYDVGIAIEKADIADLEKILAGTTTADVTRVLTNQLRASQQHLAAFEAAKAGTPLGTHDGTGMQAGRRDPGAGCAADGTGPAVRRGQGQGNAGGQRAEVGQGVGGQQDGAGKGAGRGAGAGAGQGMGPGDGTGTCVNS